MIVENMNNRQKRMYVLSSVLLAAAVLLCLCVSVQVVRNGHVSIGGYSVFRVVTGSMEPAIPSGAILLSKETPIEEIQTGDIICFRAKNTEIRGSIITHRVMEVLTDEKGSIYFETRGDANLSTDPYYVDDTNLVGRVCWNSGKENVLTDMLLFISGKFGFFACIVFPLLLVSGLIMKEAVHNLQKDINMLREELSKEPEPQEPDVPGGEDLLPGYSTLTYNDYNAIYEKLKRELLEELYELAESEEAKTK